MEVYRGYWKEDKRHGHGVEKNSRGDIYEGSFKVGCIDLQYFLLKAVIIMVFLNHLILNDANIILASLLLNKSL